LPDTLPATGVRGLLSGSLGPFPPLPNQLDLDVTIGADGPRTVTLAAKPTSLQLAARLLQAALRDATGAGTQFRGSRVTTTSDDRLLIVPGGLAAAVAVADGPAADALQLGQASRPIQHGRLSGALLPFPTLTAAQPQLAVTVGADSATVTLARRPVTPQDAATLLDAELRSSAGPGLAGAVVAVVDDQLLLVPGTDAALEVAAVAGADATSPAELQLRARYPVRIRVDGAESIDAAAVELP
jgi:hypothetical protein